jgi:hypothetical protein
MQRQQWAMQQAAMQKVAPEEKASPMFSDVVLSLGCR